MIKAKRKVAFQGEAHKRRDASRFSPTQFLFQSIHSTIERG